MSTFKKWYLHILIFMLIYIEFGYNVVVSNSISGTMRMLILLGMLVPLILFTINGNEICLKTFFLFLFIILIVIVQMVLRADDYENYFLWAVPIIVGFAVSVFVKKDVFVHTYCNIVFFLAVFSLGVYFLNVFAQPVIAALPSIGTRYGATINNAFFSVAITNSLYIRNYGITWEPGAFSVLLCLDLYFEFIYYPKIRKIRVVAITIAVLTTFSTTGYFFIALLYLALFLSSKKEYNNNDNNSRKSVVIFLSIFLVMVFVMLPQESKELIFGKLDGLFNGGEGELSYTTETRLNAIKYPFEAFLSSPIVGLGYDNFEILNRVTCQGLATNTIMNWFALSGLVFGFPCTYYYLKNLWIDKKRCNLNDLSYILLVVAFCLLVSTESLLRISLIYILVFYGSKEQDVIGREN